MIATALLLAAASLLPSQDAFTWSVPDFYIEGEPFVAELVYQGPQGEALAIPTWHLRTAGFSANGKPLSVRDIQEETLSLDKGSRLQLSIDLGPILQTHEGIAKKPFVLTHSGSPEREVAVAYLRGAAKGIDFMTMPADQLAGYQVVLVTNRGVMRAEFWPEVAPNHVRNFLDLSYSGFYDGSPFHRVIPGFMVQVGQSPTGSKAPRVLKAEFNDRRHVPGVLSAARLPNDINSASSEFFLMHAVYPSLDGSYSPFGALVDGLEVVDLIAKSGDKRFRPNDPRHSKPPEPQTLQRAIVIRTPRTRSTDGTTER